LRSLPLDSRSTITGPAPAAAAFLDELSAAVNAHFTAVGRTRAADARMIAKISFAFAAWALTYGLLLAPQLSAPAFVAAYMVHGLTHVFLVMNVGHDAGHGAISPRRRVNAMLALSLDLCGINSFMWRQLHHRAHHYCINVEGRDEALTGRGLLRFTPTASFHPWQRGQHLYALAAYALYSLDYVTSKDLRCFIRPTFGRVGEERPPLRAWLGLVGWKLFYFGYLIGAPILAGGRDPLLVGLAFVLAHALVGITVVLVFQVTHVVDGAAFPTGGDPAEGFVDHVLATTQDVATRAGAFGWLVGGLNHHVIHHLFPGICHIHFDRLTPLVAEAAQRHGLAYREAATFSAGIRGHFRHLRRLGSAPGT
jgi:linoleoyl-CoA desaturase